MVESGARGELGTDGQSSMSMRSILPLNENGAA